MSTAFGKGGTLVSGNGEQVGCEELAGLDLFGAVMDLVKARMSFALKNGGDRLLLMEAHVLRVVHAYGGATQLDVIRETRRDKAQIGKLIRSLVGRGLLMQERDPQDARRQRLRLTADGEALAPRAAAHRAAVAHQLFQGIAPGERNSLLASLRQLERSLANDADDGP